MRHLSVALSLLLGAAPTSLGFHVQRPLLYNARTVSTRSPRNMSEEEDSAQTDLQAPGEASRVNGASLVLQNDSRASLASAFSNLSENDQYDAVLTGLCAKILDDTSEEKAISSLQDPVSLIVEMNGRNVKASGRSLMALIDATVKTQDARAMTNTLSLCLKNGGMTQYGSFQNTITSMPSVATSLVMCPDGSRKSRQERLASLPQVPFDDRGSEVTAALAFTSLVGFSFVTNVLGMDEISGFTNLLLTATIVVAVVDNFYGVIKGGAELAAKNKVDVNLPEKEDLPLNLGSGAITGTVVRGLTRLMNVDTERECECEAAAFFAAYSLGLPCFAFRPNALEAAVLVGESMKTNQEETELSSKLDPLLSDVGIMKMLIWLMAPVAMESSKHAQLIVSDPREAAGFLKRLQQRAELFGDEDALWWMEEEQEQNDLLKWAYAEADFLLRSNKETVTELTERLAGGAATVGDCVAVMEDW